MPASVLPLTPATLAPASTDAETPSRAATPPFRHAAHLRSAYATALEPQPPVDDDIGLQEVLTEGARLLNAAETLRRPVINKHLKRADGSCPSRKAVLCLGALLIGTAAGGFIWNRWRDAALSNASQPDERLPDNEPADSELPAFLPHVIWQPRTTTSTQMPPRDDIAIIKKDFSCIERRHQLSLPDVVRQIGKTLANPVSSLSEESQLIYFYNYFGRCPTPAEQQSLVAVTAKIDAIIATLCQQLPGSTPLIIAQRIAAPLFELLADEIQGRSPSQGKVTEVAQQVAFLSRAILSTTPGDIGVKPGMEMLNVPENLTVKDGRFYTLFRDQYCQIEYQEPQDRFVVINANGEKFNVVWSNQYQQWLERESQEQAEQLPLVNDSQQPPSKTVGKMRKGKQAKNVARPDRLRFDAAITAALEQVPGHDRNLFTASQPDSEGRYFFYDPATQSTQAALKINQNFYPCRAGAISGSYWVGADKPLLIMRFDDVYYMADPESAEEISYTRCRIGRMPGGQSCLHFSEELSQLLSENLQAGTPEAAMPHLKPSEDYPWFYASPGGTLFTKYNGVCFRIKPLENRSPDRVFSVFGKKVSGFFSRFRNNKIAELNISRKKGESYLNTPTENMMELTGASRVTAEKHYLFRGQVSRRMLKELWRTKTAWKEMDAGSYVSPEENVARLEQLMSHAAENHPVLSTFTEGGSRGINRFLRSGKDTHDGYYQRKAQQLLNEYQQLASYDKYAYRAILMPKSRIDALRTGDIITDRGFASASALWENAREWSASPWLLADKQPTDNVALIVYDKEVEKKIASNDFLPDHILIRPQVRLMVKGIAKLARPDGSLLKIFAVARYNGNAAATDIVTGESLPSD